MTEEINFVKDLAIILISAGVFTIVCRALKQPSILGYIIAGFLISPNLGLFGITSPESVHQWSDIGIIFLMFGLGLEFSFKKLMKVGSAAFVTAGSKFLGVFVIGYLVGLAMGWSGMESTFLAGLLSMSSTVVVIKNYSEMGLNSKPYAGIVFGTLVVEDMIAILLMVLLSGLAVAGKFSGAEMLWNLAKLIFFLVIWFLVGIYVIPTVLKKARSFINDEVLLIVSIGLCFGMVTLAEASGFSSALGAFMMGSILAETLESEHIDRLISPIKDLFGAVFFVSVGMMIAPQQIASHWWIILILALVVMITHILFVTVGIVLSGGNLSNGVHSGFSLAQLGEFGFIIASVGVNLGVMREFIYPVIISVSVLTIFTTPYMIKLADPCYAWLQKKLPAGLLARIDRPDSDEKRSVAEKSEWKKLLRGYLGRIFIYGIILVGILNLSDNVLDPAVQKYLPRLGKGLQNLLKIVVTLAVMSPFLYGLGFSAGALNSSASKLIKEKRGNAWPLLGLVFARIFIAVGFILAVVAKGVELSGWVIVLLLVGGALLFFFSRYYIKRLDTVETRFLSNLNAKEESARKKRPVSSKLRTKLAGYDVHIEELRMDPDSSYAGSRLMDIPIRSQSGANIIKIMRGSQNLLIPSAEEILFPGDTLLAVGTTEQLQKLRSLMEDSLRHGAEGAASDFDVVNITLESDSYLTGQSLRSLDLRSYGCMVVSVVRGEQVITNPKPDFVFSEGDVVWLAGDTASLDWLS